MVCDCNHKLSFSLSPDLKMQLPPNDNSLTFSHLMVNICLSSIRAVNLLPNRVIGCIGQHVGEPIEELAKSWDSRFLASTAHDQLIKFWDISSLPNTTVSEYRKRKKKDGRMKSLTKKAHGENDFFSGLVEETEKTEQEQEQEEIDEDDSDSDSGSD